MVEKNIIDGFFYVTNHSLQTFNAKNIAALNLFCFSSHWMSYLAENKTKKDIFPVTIIIKFEKGFLVLG